MDDSGDGFDFLGGISDALGTVSDTVGDLLNSDIGQAASEFGWLDNLYNTPTASSPAPTGPTPGAFGSGAFGSRSPGSNLIAAQKPPQVPAGTRRTPVWIWLVFGALVAWLVFKKA